MTLLFRGRFSVSSFTTDRNYYYYSAQGTWLQTLASRAKVVANLMMTWQCFTKPFGLRTCWWCGTILPNLVVTNLSLKWHFFANNVVPQTSCWHCTVLWTLWFPNSRILLSLLFRGFISFFNSLVSQTSLSLNLVISREFVATSLVKRSLVVSRT